MSNFSNPYGASFATDPRFLTEQQKQEQQQDQQGGFNNIINQLDALQGGGAAGASGIGASGGGLGASGVGSIAAPAGGATASTGGLGSLGASGVGSIAAPAGGAGASSGGLGGLGASGLSLSGTGASAGGGAAAGGGSSAAGSALASNPVGWIVAAALAQNVAHNKGIASWQSALKGQAGGNIGSHFMDQWGVDEDSPIRDVAGVAGWDKDGGGVFNPNYLSKKLFGSVD